MNTNAECMQLQERALHYDIPYKPWPVVGANIFMINHKNLLCDNVGFSLC